MQVIEIQEVGQMTPWSHKPSTKWDLSRRKDWWGREDLNLRPPGPEDRSVKIQVLHLVSLRSQIQLFFLSLSCTPVVPNCSANCPQCLGYAAFAQQQRPRTLWAAVARLVLPVFLFAQWPRPGKRGFWIVCQDSHVYKTEISIAWRGGTPSEAADGRRREVRINAERSRPATAQKAR
jgi:hypothetical protein